jgi:dipeptidyl aminopeptidase/acylaminoacyl peptidase
MAKTTIVPYGSWTSPISAAQAAAQRSGRNQAWVSEGFVYWTENRPEEGGRVAVMRKAAGKPPEEATPPDFNCRTRVHEYGGGAFLANGETLFCSKFEDQRLYRIEPGADPVPITPEPPMESGLRYADGRLTPDGKRILCVRESHRADGKVSNEIVIIRTNGSVAPQTLVSGRDFYAAPRPSPDGKSIAWLEWDHPRMPWDGTELWLADLTPENSLESSRRLAGGPTEAIFQPEWSPTGVLHFVSDRTGWWNLYRWEGDRSDALLPMEAEFGSPAWHFGYSHYAFLPDGRIVAIYSKNGIDHLGWIPAEGQKWTPIETGLTSFDPPSLHFDGGSGRLVFVGGAPDRPPAVFGLQFDSGKLETLSAIDPDLPDPGTISHPRPITFPTSGGQVAHALFYPPQNRDHQAPEISLPPLIVISHGGPTSNATSEFYLPRQFWTSRGFAVVDVNYRGSSGYGRAYRELLNGTWGVFDVEDCIAAAKYLVDQGEADPERLIIRGGSAGGYTTLCALTFHDVFAAGASYYGVADLESLARDTHKFESRYLDSLIGPYPQVIETYRQRSPIHFAGQLACPIILFQGLEDRVVPPAQAETMVAALQSKGLPHAYLAFEGEAHGFRKVENIRRALEAELYFYSRIFGFELPDRPQPVEIKNLPGLQAPAATR